MKMDDLLSNFPRTISGAWKLSTTQAGQGENNENKKQLLGQNGKLVAFAEESKKVLDELESRNDTIIQTSASINARLASLAMYSSETKSAYVHLKHELLHQKEISNDIDILQARIEKLICLAETVENCLDERMVSRKL